MQKRLSQRLRSFNVSAGRAVYESTPSAVAIEDNASSVAGLNFGDAFELWGGGVAFSDLDLDEGGIGGVVPLGLPLIKLIRLIESESRASLRSRTGGSLSPVFKERRPVLELIVSDVAKRSGIYLAETKVLQARARFDYIGTE